MRITFDTQLETAQTNSVNWTQIKSKTDCQQFLLLKKLWPGFPNVMRGQFD